MDVTIFSDNVAKTPTIIPMKELKVFMSILSKYLNEVKINAKSSKDKGKSFSKPSHFSNTPRTNKIAYMRKMEKRNIRYMSLNGMFKSKPKNMPVNKEIIIRIIDLR